MRRTMLVLAFATIALEGCGTTQQFTAIPPDLDRARVTVDTIDVQARRYVFLPENIPVQHGHLIVLRIVATDTDHGFDLPAFGIDERLEKGVTRLIEFYPPVQGKYDFKCSHLCGIGHFGMSGQIVVE